MTDTVDLDSNSLHPEDLSKETLMRELQLKKRPFKVLRLLMNTLEKKRQKKKLGWSRPWNKIGLNVFRTHLHEIEQDVDYLEQMFSLILSSIPTDQQEYRDFVEDLFRDPKLMAFTFYHNNCSPKGDYEGLTLSLGRKIAEDRTKRDRIDILLENRRIDGAVDGRVDRIRLYVNPWEKYQHDDILFIERTVHAEPEQFLNFQNAYALSVQKYHLWKKDPTRQWEHWSVRYIEYFGSRSFIPQGSSFT